MYQLEKLLYTREKLKAELSLYEFLKQSWHIIGGDTSFDDTWHLKAIAEHLEACVTRDIKRLIINVPPRTGKTTLLSIVFPIWVWIHHPTEKFMYASYATTLSIEHSNKCRRLFESNWFQERWGDRLQLAKDQNVKSYFENNWGGYRIATSVGATATGFGGSILILDDPNNMKYIYSQVIRTETNRWDSEVWSSRLNNPINDVKIIIQQRGHMADITGNTIDKDTKHAWVHLNLPNEYEIGRKCKTTILPSTNGKVWEDPRTLQYELLCPNRISSEVTQGLKTLLGTYGYAAQYQQQPVPEGGGIIKREWFKWWKQAMLPKMEFVVQSWDTAFSASKDSAYSACTTWGIFYDQYGVENVMLLSLWKDHLDYPELREMAKRLYRDYRDTGKEPDLKLKGGKHIDLVMVEAKATGTPLIQDLYKAGISCQPFNPTGKGDKVNRVYFIAPLIEGGRVWLPTDAPTHTTLSTFAEQFLNEAALFPALECNDLVDTMSQALTRFKEGGLLNNPKDFIMPKNPTPPRKFYGLG